MTNLIWNLIEINVVIVLLFVGYFAIRNHISFKQQRGVLIGIPFLAIGAIIAKSMVDFSAVSYSIPIVKLEPIMVGPVTAIAQATESPFNWTFFYEIGALFLALLLVLRLVKLGLFFVRNSSEKNEKYHIYKVDGKSSFSFFNRIQITPNLGEEEQQIVLEHEKMHADKWHSFDIIITELFHVAFWFNPIFFFIKRELINLHEFEVDALMYKKHKVSYMKFLVNYALGLTTSNYLLTSRFYNKLTLKKRIETMKTNYKKRSWVLGILPLAAIAFILVQCTKQDFGAELTEDSDETTNEVPPINAFTLLQESGEDGIVGYFSQVWQEGEEGQLPFMAYVFDNVRYPEEALKNGEEGTVIVEFIVTENGKIENPWIRESVSESLDKEALRVVSQAPYFEPTVVNGEAVRARQWAPVTFELENEEKSRVIEEKWRAFVLKKKTMQ